jgi:hypothetical protein
VRTVVVTVLAGAIVLSAACVAHNTLSPVAARAPDECRLLSGQSSVSLPFEIYHGDIRFEAKINGHPVHLLLDDGFMWDALLFWGGPRVDCLGLTYDGEVSVGGAREGGGLASRTASGITVGLPGVELAGQTAVVTPASSGNSTMWAGSIGQISAALFKHFVVAIDFDTMTITLTVPDRFTYRGRGVEIPWRPLGFGPWGIPAILELADGRTVSLEVMMDLGYNDQLQLAVGREHGINAPAQSLPASLGFNIQGTETVGRVGRLRAVRIGGFEIENPVVAYVSEQDSAKTYSEAMIGLGLLSRFNLVFDLRRQRLIVQPNRGFGRPFEYNMTGLDIRPDQQGRLTIVRVHDPSPASAAGLAVGDTVLKINGRPAADYDVFELREISVQRGATVTLVVVRGDEEREVRLTLRRLV